MANYAGDPYWITCKYPGVCRSCKREIRKGDRAFRYKDGSLFGEKCTCGIIAENDFESAKFDEAVYNGEFC